MVSFAIVMTATTYLLHVWEWMILTIEPLLVDIFSLADYQTQWHFESLQALI